MYNTYFGMEEVYYKDWLNLRTRKGILFLRPKLKTCLDHSQIH
jgi:hypothetical protein